MSSIPDFFRGKVSVSFRIALYVSIAFSFILLLISFTVLSSIHIFLLKESKQFLLYNEKIIQKELTLSPAANENPLAGLAVSKRVQITIYNRTGTLLFVKNQMFPDTLITSDGIQDIRLSREQNGEEYNRHDQKDDGGVLHFMALRYTVNNSSGTYIIQIAKDLSEEDYFLSILYRFLIISDIAGILISLAAGFIVSSRILKPISNVTDTALSISAKELTMRIPNTGPEDELKKLVTAFNGMLDRLDDSFTRQNRFVSNASHELRTPLSIINGYLGILSRWGKEDPHVLSESLDAIESETRRMSSLIDKLLFLAKEEDGALEFEKKPVDLGIVLHDIRKDSKLLFPKKKFRFKISKGCIIMGDNDMLRQMFLVFVDNEGKYSDTNSEITLFLDKNMESVLVTIRDEGPGIEKEKLKYIFDRFYRLDDARDKVSGGAGLGLSIAREIIELHGGSVRVESSLGRGTVFTLRFPRTDSMSHV